LQPNGYSLWSVLITLAAGILFWSIEILYVRRAEVRPAAPRFLVDGFLPATIITTTAAIVAALFLATRFEILVMYGGGMAPTIDRDEWLFYYKRVEWHDLQPGRLIVFLNSPESVWGQSGDLLVARILAGPGDRISLENGQYIVNGSASALVDDSHEMAPVVDVPCAPEEATVPDDCYFVVQDAPGNPFDSRFFSWVHRNQIVGSRIWTLDGHELLQEVD
jgi:signal peptidase I